jgi:hypothetical protein
MVYLRGKAIPNELVGLEEPDSYIHALLSFTAKQDKERASVRVKKGNEVIMPIDNLYSRIKIMSLFPNIYTKPEGHRTFPKKRVQDDDGNNLTLKPSKGSREDGVLM